MGKRTEAGNSPRQVRGREAEQRENPVESKSSRVCLRAITMYKHFSSPTGEGKVTTNVTPDTGIEVSQTEYSAQDLIDHGHELLPSDYFEQVGQLALDYVDAILEHWLPEGEQRGRHYKAYNPLRADSSLGSFSINIETAVWKDFAIDEGGGDLVSLVCYLDQLEYQSEAAKRILEFIVAQQQGEGPFPRRRARVAAKSSEYTPVFPIPESAIRSRPVFFGAELGKPVAEWCYRDTDGNPMLYVLRFQTEAGKEYRPQTYCRDSAGACSWRLMAPATQRPLYGLDRLAANPDAVVIVVEGEKAADAGQRLFPDSVVVTTMNGAQSPDKADFAPLAGRRVLIAPDNDEAGSSYMNKVAALAKGVGARVGAYLRIDALSKDGQPVPKGYDLADAEADGWTAEELERPERWAALQQQELPDAAPTAIEQVPVTLSKATVKKGNKQETMQERVEAAVDTLFGGNLAFVPGAIRAYQDGYWASIDATVEIKKPLLSILGKAATVGDVTGYLDMMGLMYAEGPERFERRSPLICLRNGTLDPTTGELLPHSPQHYLCNSVAIHFDASADCPLWLKTLAEIFEPDADRDLKIQLLQEFIGYCLVADTSIHKFLWLVGGGGNGKSLILSILTALIGKDNISNAQIERFDRAFVRAELQGKLVNISSEMSAEATVSDGYVKQIVSGDIIEAERKYQPSFDFKPYARLIAATNTLPRLLDHSDGFFRRAMILRFNRQFACHEQDKSREQKLIAELPGILNWALEGRNRLYERGDFDLPPSCRQELGKYRVDSDPIRQFADDHLEPSADHDQWINAGDLYECYRNWSEDNGCKTLGSPAFKQRLEGIGYKYGRSSTQRFWRAAMKGRSQQVSVSELANRYSV